MENQPERTTDPLLSEAETRAGGTGSFFSPGLRGTVAPDFPVKDWDRYEFLGFLGQGGMGMVFQARDRRLGRDVAIKFVRIENDRHVQRFMLEARAQARVDHEHVCKVYEVGEIEGKVFITMQYIAGASLDVAASGLSLEQKVLVLRDAAQGVHEAHRIGIIHRDLKPSNIMVDRAEDGALRTFVMDFGLAQEWNQDVTETGSVLGTPAFMSPEQARGEVSTLDRRTDVYSLGATLYQLVAGRPPVSGSNPLEVLSGVVNEEVRSLRALGLDAPRDLEAIIMKCLEKERAKRYGSAKALVDDLDRFLSGEPVQARPRGVWYWIQRKLWKHKELASVVALALVVVVLALGAALKTRRNAARRERLAQHFTEAIGRIEATARYSALSPLHDIRPDLQAIRVRMNRVQADMTQAGALANGSGNYALGIGDLTLDDEEKAREHLQLAWDAGFREPRAAYALALVLGRQYREKLLEAERISSVDQREARTRDLEVTLRTPALAFLKQARGSDAPDPAYLEALMAFYEGRLDEALAHLKTVEGDLPWFYEAPLLRGSLLQTRAWQRWNQGDREGAMADFEAGRVALRAAASSGRSAPAVYAALGQLEQNAMIMEEYGRGDVQTPFEHGMNAVQTALTAQADHVPSLILEARLLGQFATFKSSRGEPAADLAQRAVAIARKAQEAGPARADARIALGMAYYGWGSARLDQNLDPTEQLTQGLQAFGSLAPEQRDYQVENHIGLIDQTWSDFEAQNGRDPAAHLDGAIAAYGRATRMEPRLLPAWINLGTCLQQRAGLPRAAHPEGDLQAALQALDQAQHLNPRHFVPYFVRGKVLYHLALLKRDRGEAPEPDLQRSAEANRQGIAINANIPHLHNGLGLALLQLAHASWDAGGDPFPLLATAEKAYKRAIAVAPKQVFGYSNLGDLLIWKARWERGRGSVKSLQEAGRVLNIGLQVAPGHLGTLNNLGLMDAVGIETILREGGNPIPLEAQGKASLAKVLARDPRNADAWKYTGELRAAQATWKARHGQAEGKDFDQAQACFTKALEITPDDQEAPLSLARLCLGRAAWERTLGRDPALTLAQGQTYLSGLLKLRPRWAEAMAIYASLCLEGAESVPPPGRVEQAREARRAFTEAFRLNQNLIREWKSAADRSGRLL